MKKLIALLLLALTSSCVFAPFSTTTESSDCDETEEEVKNEDSVDA